jgi:hypothetical protein
MLAAVTSLIAVLALPSCGEGGDGEEFTSKRLAAVLAVAERRAGGEYAELLQIEMTPKGTDIVSLGKNGTAPAEMFSFAPGSDEPRTKSVVVVGLPSGFPFFIVEARAVDKLVSGAKRLSGQEDFEISSLLLRENPDTGRGPYWWIRYNAGGRNDLSYVADKDGTHVRPGA